MVYQVAKTVKVPVIGIGGVSSAEDVIEVEVCPGRYGRQEEVALCYDGAVRRKLVSGDRVCIRRAEETAKLIKLSKESFMKTMREKMKGN